MMAEARLLDAVTQVAARQGYAQLTVGGVLAASGVSRATFYQYFADIDDCFQSAYRHHAGQLLAEIARLSGGDQPRALTVLELMVDMAISRPDVARVLMIESLAAGPVVVRERDALISKLEHAMTSPPQGSKIDLPAAILVGGVSRFLDMRLLDGGACEGLRREVLEWAAVFARRTSQPSWSAGLPLALPQESPRPFAPVNGCRGRGAPRERLLRATATIVRDKGYRDSTVADIVSVAGVSRRGFYNVFHSKADAFMAAYEDAFERTVAACAPAFFCSGGWPQRVWRSALEFTSFLSREPLPMSVSWSATRSARFSHGTCMTPSSHSRCFWRRVTGSVRSCRRRVQLRL
jgi:AcrR family transcriptional regulator